MWRIIYTSHGARHWHVTEYAQLEQIATQRNAERDLTGLLLYDGAAFVQALEGPEAMVRLTMDQIGQDRRHRQIVIAVDEAASSRQFGDWSMRCRRMPEQAVQESGAALLASDMADVTDPRLRAIFLDFARVSVQRARRLRVQRPAATWEERAMETHLDLLVQKAQEALDRTQAIRRLADDAARLDSATRQQFRIEL